MPSIEDIVIKMLCDPSGLLAGTEAAKKALQGLQAETDKTDIKFKGVDSTTRSLFRTMVEFRVAAMSVENVMKAVGIQNDFVNKVMGAVNLTMDAGIAIMAVYRAALAAKTLAHWLSAKAAAAEAIAEGGVVVPIVGFAIAGAALGIAIGAMFALMQPRMARGGIIMPRAGGTSVVVGEAGYPEAIIPLKPGVSYGDVHVTQNIYSNDPDYISRQLARLIEQRRAAGY